MSEFYDSGVLELHTTLRDFAMLNIQSEDCTTKLPFIYAGINGYRPYNSYICTEICFINDDYIFHTSLTNIQKRKFRELTEKLLPKLHGKAILVDGDENAHWLWKTFGYMKASATYGLNILNIKNDLPEFNTTLSNEMKFDCCDFHSRQRYGSCAMRSALWLQDLTRKNFCTCPLHKKIV